jgi:Rhs element Vgr protein
MAKSVIADKGLVTFVVKANGKPLDCCYRVMSVTIEQRVNRIARARIVLLDGEPNTGEFPKSASKTFLPGNPLTVEAGYDNANKLVFKGIITGQSIRIDDEIGSALEVECRDESVKMIAGRKTSLYEKKKDSEIISSIIGQYSGLTAKVTASTTPWPSQVQYYVSDWDFILSLAEANGFIVTTFNGTVTVAKPNADTTPVITVGYGDQLLEFNADLNAINQYGNVKATAWNFKDQALSTGQKSPDVKGPGDLTSKKLSEVLGLKNYELQTTAPVLNGDLTTWSAAQIIKSEFSKITGTAKFQGSNLAVPAKYITLEGLGDRFNGDYFMSGVTHTISDGNWFTEVSLGMSPEWFTQEPDVMTPPAAGLLPGARGLFNGTVKKIANDPDKQYRILVSVPLFGTTGEGLWARLSNFYSSNNCGAFFLPEVGDEVILGFLNEDPRFPVILGSLYSGPKLKPFAGLEPKDGNPVKAIVTKSGIYIQFDDKDKILTLTTPGKNMMEISDKDKKITIKDQNGNSIILSDSGITLKSPKDITIDAQQKVNIKGMQGVTIQSSGGDVNVSGVNIKESAKAQFTAEGSATAKVTGGAQLTLKAAIVMIN